MGGEFTAAYGWLVAGAIFLAIETFGVPGIGFLFAGLAAIIVGLLVHFEILALGDVMLQSGIFFGLTVLMAGILWKKLKKWRVDPSADDQFSNMVGDLATVGKGGLVKGEVGQASWSGTTMMAELADDCAKAALDEGAMVSIKAVKGNKLIVAPA